MITTSTFAPRLSLVLALTLAASAPLAADEIFLANGRRLEGTATFLEDGRVEIHAAFGTLVIPADKVARIESKTSLDEAVRAALARMDERDAEGRYQLALWCRGQGATTLSRRLLAGTLAIDPGHAGARQALGYRFAAGRWLTEAEYHALRGEVKFRGAWVSAAERERVLAWETAQAVLEAERRRADARAAEVAAAEARLVLAQERAREPVLYGYDPYGYVVPIERHPPHRPHHRRPPGNDQPPVPPPPPRPVQHKRNGFPPTPR